MSQQLAVVTGAATGLGRAIVQRLADQGWRVVGTYGSSAKAAADLAAEHADVVFRQVNLAVADECVEFAGAVLADEGIPHLLVNCAGLNIDRPLADITVDQWDRVFAVNVRAPFLLIQRLGAKMREHEDACIVNVGATTGIRPRIDGANYCSSKAALHHLTKTSALELAPNVRVNTLIPGFIKTDEMWQRLHLYDPEVRAQLISDIPAGRLSTPDEFARSLDMLTGPAGRYINGQKIIVDGGHFMY